ncbi:MAG: dockerin type I repeat-containing protein, partial [bacterium]
LIGGIPEPGLTCLGEVWACCIPGADCQNLDPACCQAFGGTPIVGQLCTGTIEACCFQDGSCQNLDPTCCLAFGGTPQGAGTVCLGDNDGNNIDDACEQTTPRGACCYEGPAGPLCVETTPESCSNSYCGSSLGAGTTCLPEQACCFQDGSCLMLDPLCCELFGGTPGGAGSTCSNPTACCLPDGSCEMLDPFCCEIIGGVPEPNLTCLGEVWACCIPGADCQNLDPACCQAFGGTPLIGTLCTGTIEACCFQDGSCQNLDPACCEAFGGTPQGPGTVCLGDNNGNMIDDACEQTPGEGACCVQTSCFITTAADCSAAGGTYFGDGTVCGIDANGNGIPDICDSWNPGDDHKMHYPQLPDEEGWDVKAFAPAVVSDDWQCTQTGPVSDIHFWGSWLHGLPGNILGFWISIHADIPASDSPTGYSMPGPLLWLEFFDNYNAIPINTDLTEGWYDPTVPPAGIVIPNDHTQYFQYNIFVEPDRWFYQKEGTIYWLDISAVLEDTVITKWGWKSSIEHFNDDATWGVNTGLCTVPDDGTGTADLPGDCPYTPQTDTAIIITGGLPAGTTIEADPVLQNPENVQTLPGGDLGGVIKIYTEILQMELTGTGGLGTFHRNIGIPVQVEVHLAPWTPGEPVQEFETDMVRLQGEIFGDPDFDMLRVTAGTGNGMPSPGHTTLTRLPSGNWNVDSFFDIEYRIDFQGAPGSVLQDFEGTTQGTIRLRQGGEKVPTWHELYEPPGFQVSMDMAFVITGEFLCDCRPGDPNNDGTVNITDAVYMINYIFGGGPAPTPYAVCSGDANCDCLANITDAVYLINYIFGGGSPPCDCPTWLSTCGPPLY